MLNGKLKLQVHCQGCCPKRARLMLASLKRFLCQFKHNLSKTKIIPESKKATNLFYGAVSVDICLLASPCIGQYHSIRATFIVKF